LNNVRSWVFRVLVLIGAALMLYTWFTPWWTAYVVELDVTAVKIFPYGMEVNMGGYEHWLGGADEVMPGWFTPFMWVYLGLCMIALLISLFINSEKRIVLGKFKLSLPQTIVSVVGLSYVIVVISAVGVIAMNAPNFYNAPLQGSVKVTMSSHETSFVNTALQFAYWLAGATGLMLTILGLLRSKIVGKA